MKATIFDLNNLQYTLDRSTNICHLPEKKSFQFRKSEDETNLISK